MHAAWPSTDTGNVLVLCDAELPVDGVAGLVARMASADEAPDELAAETAWHRLETKEVAAQLGTSVEHGLSDEAAHRRLAAVGPNQIPLSPGRTSLEIAGAQFATLPTLLLVGAGAISLLSGGLADAVAIFGVVALNAAIGFTVESRSEKTIRLLGSEAPTPTTIIRNGQRREIAAGRLVPGDIVLLSRGAMISADARIVRAHELHIDEAMLTGESLPVSKHPAALSSVPVALADRRNMAYRGTVVTSGTGVAIVVATGVQTEIGRLQRLLGTTSRPPTPMERELDRLGGRLTWASIALGGAAALLSIARGLALAHAMRTAAALAIAAIPEGLPTVASATLARNVEMMHRHGVLVRRLDAVETLGAVQVLCFDKTGTLTFNQMSVASIAYGNTEQMRPHDLPPLSQDAVLRRLLEISMLCSDVSIDPTDGTLTGSETETALVRLAEELGVNAAALRERQPMLSIRHRSEAERFMATTHAMPDGSLITMVKGDPLDVLALCERRMQVDGTVALTSDARAATSLTNAAMAGRALRVLGFAFGAAHDLSNLVWVGLVGLADAVRPSAKPLMQSLRRAHIHPLVLTGDQVATARAIGDELGLNGHGQSVVVDSAELAGMTSDAIIAAARRAHVFARVSPEDKLRIVQTLQHDGTIVGMVGDGFNDSPALNAANVGIAMGGAGAEAARDAADIVMQTEDLGALAVAIEQGRAAFDNVRRATGYLLGTNFSEIAYVMAGTAASVEPLSPAQLLWINIVSDVLPGIGLSAEPPDPATMQRPPRSTGSGIVGGSEVQQLLTEGSVMAAGALTSSTWGRLRFGAGPEMHTMGFGSLLLGQLLHAFNRRAPGRQPGSNPTFFAAMGVTFGAQAIALMVPALRGALGIVPLGPGELAVTLAGGAVPFFLNRMLRPNHSAAADTTDAAFSSAARSLASST